MKNKLRNLVIAAGSLMAFSLATPTFAKTINVPEYSLDGVKPEVSYLMHVGRFPDVPYTWVETNNPEEALLKREAYKIDRNGDGKTDLVVGKLYLINKFYSESEPLILLMTSLAIDDDYDNTVERVIRDVNGDNKFDEEEPYGTINDFLK